MKSYFKSDIERWLFYMRYISTFKSAEIAEKVFGDDFKEVLDATRIDKLSEDDLFEYFKACLDNIPDEELPMPSDQKHPEQEHQDQVHPVQKHQAQARPKAPDLSEELAKNLIIMGLPLDEVSIATGLPIEDVKKMDQLLKNQQ